MKSNYELWKKYDLKDEKHPIRVEDIIFSSRHEFVMVAIWENSNANYLALPIYYVEVQEFNDEKLLQREVSSWAIERVLPPKKLVDPFLAIYLK